MNLSPRKLLKIIGLPLLFAFVGYYIFGVDNWNGLFSIMSVRFIFFIPFAIGVLTVYFSPVEKVRSYNYRFLAPWGVIGAFFLLTLLFSIEGWACWLMIMPVFLIASSFGGLIGGRIKMKQHERKNLHISLLVLLPFMISPVERYVGEHPSAYKAYTFIDIAAPKETI